MTVTNATPVTATRSGRARNPAVVSAPAASPAVTSRVSPTTKAATVLKLLNRARGATVPEIGELTAWQAHSVRAYLSGLRKNGAIIIREQRKTGGTAYRIVAASPQAPDAPSATTEPAVEAGNTSEITGSVDRDPADAPNTLTEVDAYRVA